MRPIHLAVAGLHSFRERQDIDFSELCEGGVFGIFGPTGSGKSSLLDAITLALYGKVERASNNTQGILNHAEDEIYVSFSFELGNAEETNHYQVERSLKRSGDVSLRTAICRLLEITDEQTIVIADKMNEVNQGIQELLGLTIDDFTRAVVLPQGKFAEFLQLKGTDRRQMLQRLFHLEKYGDVLNQKLRRRFQSLDSKRLEKEAEQKGLGDASKEALEQTKQRLTESEQQLEAAQKEYEQFEALHIKSKQVWEWQEEKRLIQNKLDELIEQKENMNDLEKKLLYAEEAERLRPYLDELEYAIKQANDHSDKLEQIKLSYEQVKADYEEALKQFEEAKQEKEKLEHPLIIKIEQLTQAQEIEREINTIQLELQTIRKQIEEHSFGLESKRTLHENTVKLREKALKRQQELKERLKETQVSVNKRELIRKGNEAKQKIVILQDSKRQLEQERLNQQSQLKQALDLHDRNNQAFQNKKEQAQRQFDQTSIVYNRTIEVERGLEWLLNMGHRFLKEVKITIDQKNVNRLALQLAEQLKSGEACPVCGSTHHPNPMMDIDHEDESIRRLHDQLEATLSIQTGKQQALKIGQQQLQSTADALIDALKMDTNVGQQQFAAALEPFKAEGKRIDTIVQYMEVHEDLMVEIKALHQDVLECQKEGKKKIAILRETEQKLIEANLNLIASQKKAQEYSDKLTEASDQMNSSLEKWTNEFAPLQYEHIGKEQQLLTEMDQRAIEINEGIDKSIPFIEEKEKEISTLQSELNQLSITIAKDQSLSLEKEKVMKDRSEKLAKIIGNEDLQTILRQLRDKLELIRANESNANEKCTEQQQVLQVTEKELAISKDAKKTSDQRLVVARNKWENFIQETKFDSIKEVKQAFSMKEERAQWANELKIFHEQLKEVSIESERLSQLLGDKQLTSEGWESIQTSKIASYEKLSDARERRGAAVESLNEIEKKVIRFNELEKERKEIMKELAKVEKLQTVFRGNTFVEFIAEEQLIQVSFDASERLDQLTRGRYAIEVNSEGGFVIRDDANGGVRRPVSTLSGGETFLTSLALALSLSAQIQLCGQYPLEFFFLDEGFGTLDQDLLDIVISALEKLHSDRLSVGVISHVQELRARLPRKLIVEPAEPSGRGSQVRLEKF